jgi:hypothetical protein
MSGLLTKAEIAQGSMSNSECFDSLARSFETRSRPRFLAATLATLPSMSLFPKAPFGLSVYNPCVCNPHEVGSIREHARSVHLKAAWQFHCSTQEAQVMVS